MSPIEVLAAELVEARQDADRLAAELDVLRGCVAWLPQSIRSRTDAALASHVSLAKTSAAECSCFTSGAVHPDCLIHGVDLKASRQKVEDALNHAEFVLDIADDPNVERGSVRATEVTVTQYIRPDTSIGVRTHYDGDGSLSQVLGLLVLAAIDIYDRSER